MEGLPEGVFEFILLAYETFVSLMDRLYRRTLG
ncbi:MAG: hypothetical protein JWM95_390 [Gemmatimonadetes bacterium]|nr:hypothetical protein [Gemmatimonadota bacterium]